MARNDVYLNINSLSPADAVVTGQQDMTAATIPELVLGDTPTFNFYFTDNTNVWPSWAGNAAYTLTWALSDAVAGDFAPAATTGNATPITGGWSVVLPLNSYDLVGLLNTKRVGQPYPVTNLWQQLRVTDPSGNEITRAMVWTPVRYRAISDTQNTESASPTGGRFVTVNNVNELTTPTDAQFYAANPVPTSALGTASNGQLFIGNGTGFTKATLTAGTGVAITNGSGSITIDATNAQELLTATVTNAEATPITKGQVVYIFGATGNRPSVKLAYNTGDATSAKTFGVVSDASIAAGGTGTVTCVGVVDGLNLGTYNDGDTVYLGATPGSITATKPYAPNHLVYVGIIERANAGNGELYVRIQNGYELDEIHDVQILTPPAAGSLLIRDNTLSLWKAATLTAGTNIAVTNGDAAVTVGLTGTVAVANGGTGVTTSTGTGSVVLSTSPSLTTPSLGAASATSINGTSIPSSKTLVVTTDKLSALAATTSAELAGVISDETGTGSLVFANTPTLVTPNIGAATGTSFNLTGSGTLGTTLTVNSTTDSSSKDTGAIVTEGGLGVEKSATIGGNLTVSGTGTSTFAGVTNIFGGQNAGAQVRISADSGATPFGYTWYSGSDYEASLRHIATTGVLTLDVGRSSSWGGKFDIYADTTRAARFTKTATTLDGNLTVSGAGNSSVGGSLGVGSTPSSGAKLDVLGNSSTGFIRATDYSSGDAGQMILRGARGTIGAPTVQSPSDSTGLVRMYGYDGTGFVENARIYASVSGAVATNQVGGVLSFWTHPVSTSAIAEAGRFTPAGNFLLGTTTDGGQKLQVLGAIWAGSTSAGGFGQVSVANNSGAAINNYMLGSTYGGTTFGGITGNNQAVIEASSLASSLYVGTGAATSIVLAPNRTAALTLDSSQNATFAGSITTAAPTTGTAGAWKLGVKVDATTTLDTTKYLQVDIGGTLYKVALVTS